MMRTSIIGQKTQPTVSKHKRKRGPKDWASIPLDPPHPKTSESTFIYGLEIKVHRDLDSVLHKYK